MFLRGFLLIRAVRKIKPYRMERKIQKKVSTLIIREKFCQDIAIGWQNFAMPMAKVCQRGGKVLPIVRQKLVKLSAIA